MVSKLHKKIQLFKVYIAIWLQCQWTYDFITFSHKDTKAPKIRIKRSDTKELSTILYRYRNKLHGPPSCLRALVAALQLNP